MGFFDQQGRAVEQEAAWMALLLSAQTGEAITPAQLLGREQEQKAGKLEEAQKSLRKLQRKMKKAGLAK